MVDLNEEFRKSIEDLSATAKQQRRVPRLPQGNGSTPVAAAAGSEPYDFAKLGEKIAESLVRAAEEQVNEAHANLERVKEFADGIRSQVSEKSAELVDMNGRLRDFAETIMSAHRRFHGESDMAAALQQRVDAKEDKAPQRKHVEQGVLAAAPEQRRERLGVVGHPSETPSDQA